jgi:predicted HTH domain antitoxin
MNYEDEVIYMLENTTMTTEEQIIYLYDSTNITLAELSHVFGVSVTTLKRILMGKEGV